MGEAKRRQASLPRKGGGGGGRWRELRVLMKPEVEIALRQAKVSDPLTLGLVILLGLQALAEQQKAMQRESRLVLTPEEALAEVREER